VKKIDMAKATRPLSEYAEHVSEGPVVVTSRGRPVAALVAVGDADLETIALSTNPKFIQIIETSRQRLRDEGGLSAEELKRRLKLKRQKRRRKT
jgi:prevent-host-death family protein